MDFKVFDDNGSGVIKRGELTVPWIFLMGRLMSYYLMMLERQNGLFCWQIY